MFDKRTIRDLDLAGRTILLRVDYNVPLKDGVVADDYRIKKSLPTINYLRERGCKLIIISHLGRPDGQVKTEFSLKPVAEALERLVSAPVVFAADCVGDQAIQAAKALEPGGLLLLENLRFHPEEEINDREFARQLTIPAEYFVQDAFGNAHRTHASMVAVTEFLPALAGFLLEEEVRQLSVAIENPMRPLVAIIGGAKIADKIQLINRLLAQANTVVIGGAMANTFLKAQGKEIGKSLYDETGLDEAKDIMSHADKAGVELMLPERDLAVTDHIGEDAARREVAADQVAAEDIILDFGTASTDHLLNIMERTGTVIWNGPLGMTELKQFALGSERLADFIAKQRVNCVVGGGDTAGFIEGLGLVDKFTHVSTGGGASLELLSGRELPAISALMDK